MNRLFKTIVLISLCLITNTYSDTIKIAAEDDWAPYAKADGTGLANEIITHSFKSVGFETQFEVLPYPRVLKYLKSARYAVGFNVPKDQYSQEQFLLSRTPLFSGNASIYTIKNHNSNKTPTLGLVHDYGYGDEIIKKIEKKVFKPHYTQSDKQLVKMLKLQRLDKIVLYDLVAQKIIDEDSNIIKDENYQSFSIPIHLAFSRKHPQSMKYFELFEKGFKIIKEKGIYKNLLEKYNHRD